MSGFRIEGNVSGNVAEVDSSHNIYVRTPGYDSTGASVGGGPANGNAMFSENDAGTATGTRYVASPETDDDYRLRMANDFILDTETFNYAAQNTGKHTYSTSTMTFTWATSGLTSNGSGITTTGTGATFGTYAEFPMLGAQHIYCETEASLTAATTTNMIIDFGLFRRGSSTAYAPGDGVYFRLNPSGWIGVVNYNGVETTVNLSAFTHTINQKYQFVISITQRDVEFWIDNVLYGHLATPSGQGQPFLSATLPFSIRHANTGTAGAVIQLVVNNYNVCNGGMIVNRTLGEIGNAALGSYQGLSGGTMGQLIAGTVTSGTLVKPTAAVPSNTSLVANLPNSLGGRIWEQLTSGLAGNTDGIFVSYTVPAGTVSVQGKRLKVTGIKLSGMVSTVVVGGPAYTEWYIAFGHTADSLATTESATSKAPRRVMLPELTTNMGAAAAAGTLLVQPAYVSMFDQPIYVNPGERIALVGNKTITTAISSGVLSFTYQFIYSWE